MSIARKLYPPTPCILCQTPHRGSFAVCEPCEAYFTPLGPACKHCANPLPDHTLVTCHLCAHTRPAIDHTFSAYRFEEPLRSVLHEFKYREGLYLTSFIAKLMQHATLTTPLETECLMPVPMHPNRLGKRGFNQAILLANHLARHIHRPVDMTSCKKIINTSQQANLDANTRKKNVQHSFQIKPQPYQNVTLIDDLVTTGSTANEIARELKRQGVLHVNLWCCAKACR